MTCNLKKERQEEDMNGKIDPTEITSIDYPIAS
jgi:hypothetical protein